jgi:hypothetical protein
MWWHLHAHAVVVFKPGVDLAEAARRFGQRWEQKSREAAHAAYQRERVAQRLAPADAKTLAQEADWGWDPVASGGVDPERLDWQQGGWWQPIGTDLDRVEQACKYLGQVAEMSGHQLVEYAHALRGHRWFAGSGIFRDVSEEELAPYRKQVQERAGRVARPTTSDPICSVADSPRTFESDGPSTVQWSNVYPHLVDQLEVELAKERAVVEGPVPVLLPPDEEGARHLVGPRTWMDLKRTAFDLALCEADTANARAVVARARTVDALAEAARRLVYQEQLLDRRRRAHRRACRVWLCDTWKPLMGMQLVGGSPPAHPDDVWGAVATADLPY